MSPSAPFLVAGDGALALTAGDSVTAVMVLVIVLLGGAAFVAGLVEYRRYGLESRALRRVRNNLTAVRYERQVQDGSAAGETEEDGTEDREVEDADVLSHQPLEVEALQADVWPDSLVYARLEAIRRMIRHRVRIDADALQRVSLSGDAARVGVSLPRYGAGTCLLLGIFGTFLGLAVVVQGIQHGLPGETTSVDVASWLGAIRELRTVLGGMRTAFWTSLAGIGAAILCSALDHSIRQRRRRIFGELERLTLEDLLPELAPATEDRSLLERVTHRLEASFERLDDIQRANEEVLKDLTGAQRAFAAIVDEMKRLTGSDARQDLREVITQLDRTSGSMLSLVEEMPRIVRAVERGSGGLQRQVRIFLHRWFPVSLALLLGAILWAVLATGGR